MELPYYYNYINAANSQVSPSTIHCSNNAMAAYFRRYLLQRAISVFKWTLPEEWSENYFKYVLYCWGYLAIVNTDKFGVIPQQCGLRGYNVFYQPTHAIVANPHLSGILEPQIGTQCEIIRLQPDYGGILDLVYYYADQLALYAEAAQINIQNSKLGYFIGTNSKGMAEAIKKIYDKIMAGEGLAVYDKDGDSSLVFETFTQNLMQNFIAPDILESMRRVENEFCTRVGIPNTNTDKKERMSTDEVNMNNAETTGLADLWLETLQDCCEKARDMFQLEKLNVKWRIDPHEQRRDNVDPGSVQLGSDNSERTGSSGRDR